MEARLAWDSRECILWINRPIAYDFYIFKLPSVSKDAPSAHEECLEIRWLRKSKPGPSLLVVLHNMQTPSKMNSCYTALPYQDNPKWQWRRKILAIEYMDISIYGYNFGSAHAHIFLLE